MKGEKGIQGDNSDDLSVLAKHRPIQLATRSSTSTVQQENNFRTALPVGADF